MMNRTELNENFMAQVNGGRFYNPGHLKKAVPDHPFRIVFRFLGMKEDENQAPEEPADCLEYGKIDPDDQDCTTMNRLRDYHSCLV